MDAIDVPGVDAEGLDSCERGVRLKENWGWRRQ